MRLHTVSLGLLLTVQLAACGVEECPPDTHEISGQCVLNSTAASPAVACPAGSQGLAGNCSTAKPTTSGRRRVSDSDAGVAPPAPPPPPANTVAKECATGETRCAAQATPAVETCNSASHWAINETCASVCENGRCAGDCKPGMKRCGMDQAPETCSDTGKWIPGARCPVACGGMGECVDCASGDKRCAGPDQRTVESCDTTGTWTGGTSCTNACVDGACTGTCMPGALSCSGQTRRTCDDKGQWQAGSPCAGSACVDGACVGICTPGARQCSGDAPQTCNTMGEWIANPTCPGKCIGLGVCVDCTADSDCESESQVCTATRCTEIQCSSVGGELDPMSAVCCVPGCDACGRAGCSAGDMDANCCRRDIERAASCKSARRAPCWLRQTSD